MTGWLLGMGAYKHCSTQRLRKRESIDVAPREAAHGASQDHQTHCIGPNEVPSDDYVVSSFEHVRPDAILGQVIGTLPFNMPIPHFTVRIRSTHFE